MGLHIFLIVSLAFCTRLSEISGSVLEKTVGPGDNVTLYCDCKKSTGVYTVWYRHCSHENQPKLVLKSNLIFNVAYSMNPIPRFHFVMNESSDSYDLLIMNTTDSDEGLYYCGTEESKVEDNKYITTKRVYTYGNITTRIIFNASLTGGKEAVSNLVPPVSWMMVFTPVFTPLSSFLCFILLYLFFQKIDKEPQILQRNPDAREQARWNQDEDVF